MSLIIPFDPAGLPPAVVGAFDDLIAAIQTWADQGNLIQRGYGTFAQPRCKVQIPSTQVISNNTDTLVTWSSVNFAVDLPEVGYDNGDLYGRKFLLSNDTILRPPPVPGLYLVAANITWEASATGDRSVWLQIKASSGLEYVLAACQERAASANQHVQQVLTLWPVVAPTGSQQWPGMQVYVYQSSGGDLDVIQDFESTWLQITKIA